MSLRLYGFADWIFDPILNAIEIGILKTLWSVLITGPLHIISAFDAVLKFLSSGVVYSLLFNADANFDIKNIPAEFWQFTIVSVVLLIFIYISQFVAWQFKDPGELKPKLMSCLRYTGLAGVFIFAIPVGFFIVNGLINWFIGMLNQIFGVQSSNLSDTLYWVGSYDGVLGAPKNYDPPSNIQNWSIILQIFGTWFVLIAILFLGMALTQKTFELFFLFLISPFVMVGMVQDEGKRALTWKDMVLSRMIAATVTLVSYYIYMFFITIIAKENFMPTDWDWKTKMLLRLLFLLGGTIAVWGITSLISAFIGEGVSASEGLHSLKSTMAAGMFTAGAAKMAGKAIGFGKSKRALKLQNKSGLNPMNALNSVNQNPTGDTPKDEKGFSQSIRMTKWGERSGLLGLAAVGAGLAARGAAGSIFAIKNSYNNLKDTLDKETESDDTLGLKSNKFAAATGAALLTPYLAVKGAAKGIGKGVVKFGKKLGGSIKEVTVDTYRASQQKIVNANRQTKESKIDKAKIESHDLNKNKSNKKSNNSNKNNSNKKNNNSNKNNSNTKSYNYNKNKSKRKKASSKNSNIKHNRKK